MPNKFTISERRKFSRRRLVDCLPSYHNTRSQQNRERAKKEKRLPHTLESEIEPKTYKSLEIHVRVLVVLDRTKTWGKVSENIRSNFEFAGTLIRSSLKVETERSQEHLKALMLRTSRSLLLVPGLV